MRKIFFFTILILLTLNLASASIDSINFPYGNDVLTYSNNIPLDVSSSGSTGCVFFYDSPTGYVPYNQSIDCNGITYVNLPNADGVYNISVMDDATDSIQQTLTISRPSGILVTFIYALSIFLLGAMLFIFVLILAKTAVGDVTIYNLGLSWAFYFTLFATYQLILEYANIPFIVGRIDLLLTISSWLVVVFPVIAFLISVIIKSTIKKQPLSVQEITGGGKFLNVK